MQTYDEMSTTGIPRQYVLRSPNERNKNYLTSSPCFHGPRETRALVGQSKRAFIYHVTANHGSVSRWCAPANTQYLRGQGMSVLHGSRVIGLTACAQRRSETVARIPLEFSVTHFKERVMTPPPHDREHCQKNNRDL